VIPHSKVLFIVAASLVVLAFVLRALLPQNLFISGGWPVGSHYLHISSVAFWVCLLAGFAFTAIAVAEVLGRGQN
jgi:hypothetical protein